MQIFLEDLGIKEDYPENSRHMEFEALEPEDIRTFNKIISHMKINKMLDVIDFLGIQNIDTITCIGKSKQEKLKIIENTKFRDILREKQIIKYGEEMSETLSQFLEISKDNIMIRKFK